ncbi:hypothetical protein HaLaN_11286, partial [Haematococcus lacustris]
MNLRSNPQSYEHGICRAVTRRRLQTKRRRLSSTTSFRLNHPSFVCQSVDMSAIRVTIRVSRWTMRWIRQAHQMRLSGHMLLEEYAAVKAEVASRLAALPFVAITVDGWSQVDIQSDTANMADVFFGATASRG